MRRLAKSIACVMAVLALVLAIAPAKAQAAAYPAASELYYVTKSDGTRHYLSSGGGSGISYNASTGVLTLNNYNNGQIGYTGNHDYPVSLTIELKGLNTVTDGSNSLYGMTLYGLNVSITSATGGTLIVNKSYTSSTSSYTYGIGAGDSLSIGGHTSVRVNSSRTDSGPVIGVSVGERLIVQDEASLEIHCSGSNVGYGIACMFRSVDPCVLEISTTEDVLFDCSGVPAQRAYGVEVPQNGSAQAFQFSNTFNVEFYCSRINHRNPSSLPANGYYIEQGSNHFTYRPYYDMYRLYNQWTGEHFYTGTFEEVEKLVTVGWTYEGIGWCAPGTGDPVYRLYNPWAPGGDHHYTVDLEEYAYLTSVGWKGEGVGWYSGTGHEVPVYREYNPYEQAHNHNYTSDLSEHNHLVSLGWHDEGIGWYGVNPS